MILWPCKKSLKWGQCLSVLKMRSCSPKFIEFFPGSWSPKHLHISLMVYRFLCCGGSYKITVVCPFFSSAVLSEMTHLSFFVFWHDGKLLEYLKTGRALFSTKIRFWPNWAKRAQIGPKIFFFYFLKSLLKI